VEKSAINDPGISANYETQISVGLEQVCECISELVAQRAQTKQSCSLAIDGFPGTEIENIIAKVNDLLKEKGLNPEILDFNTYYKSSSKIEQIIRPLLTWDESFGRVFDGKLEDFMNQNKLEELRKKLQNNRGREKQSESEVLICFGYGVANEFLRDSFDLIVYIDLTREEFVNRIRDDGLTFLVSKESFQDMDQAADVGLPVYLFKLSNYVYYPVLDSYKKQLLGNIDFYIDGNHPDNPKLVPQTIFNKILSTMVQYPVRLKPLYVPSPWGGQWIKKVRKLPKDMVNCAWSFEAIAPDMSLLIAVGKTVLEIPFLTFLMRKGEELMGQSALKRFNHFFPIRVHYDDSMDGGNMALQVHPPKSYVERNFNEKIGQDESYYIVLTGEDSKVYLGLQEGVDEEFYGAVQKAKKEGTPLDYDKYVNSIPTKPGDFFLIPAGTVHASGRNQLVLEIGNSYGYTFHVYDYLRPGLDGKLRPIHPEHSFKVMDLNRTASWVNKRLKQKPKLIRSGEDWKEYLLAEIDEIYYIAHRLEFKTEIKDNTIDRFHILTLIEGNKVVVRSNTHPDKLRKFSYSQTVIIPASFGEYSITNLGDTSCQILKVLLK
jgi:mannose-6-phosphate isomerase class I